MSGTKIKLSTFPLLAERKETRFFKDLSSAQKIHTTRGSMNLGLYTMITQHHHLKLHCAGIKMPGFRIGELKAYFGLKGRGQQLLTRFEELRAEVDRAIGL